MRTSFMRYLILCITSTLTLPSCTIQLQNELNKQKEQLAQVRKNQANHSSEIDQIKSELQFMKGSIEENSHQTQQTALELKSRIENLSFSVNQTQGTISSLQKQPGGNTKKEPQANPVSNIKSIQNKYDEAYALYKKGNYSEARKLFEDFSKTYSNDQLTDNAIYWIGNCYFKEKKHEKAISVFQDLIDKFPESNKAPDSHYVQALAFLELNDPTAAKIILEDLIQNFPSSNAASMAKTKQLQLK